MTKEILEKIAILKKNHIKVVTTFMVGIPDETEEQNDVQKTIEDFKKIYE